MNGLIFPKPTFRTRKTDAGVIQYFDIYRKKWLLLTPEEYVRQSVCEHIVFDLGYAPTLISLERSVHGVIKESRYDVLVYSTDGSPFILVECKAPQVKLSQSTLLQLSHYASRINVPIIGITNGLSAIWLGRSEAGWSGMDSLPSKQS